MIAVSRRFVPAVVVLAALAAIPVWIHALFEPRNEPCPRIAGFWAAERIGGGLVTSREPATPKRPAYLEGRPETSEPIAPQSFRVFRGFETTPFAEERVLTDPMDKYMSLSETIEELRVGEATLRVHWGIHDVDAGTRRMRAYFHGRGRAPVKGPLSVDPFEAFDWLVSGPPPHVLFWFRSEGRTDAVEKMRDDGRKWIESAWAQYTEACSAESVR